MENAFHIFGERGYEFQSLPGYGMREDEPVGMQSLSLYPLHVRIVQMIPDERITDMFHVDAYLMGAAGLQVNGDKAVPIFGVL